MKTKILIIFTTLAMLVSGCATKHIVRYKVQSTPPGARIEVDGVSHGKTPIEVPLSYSKVVALPGGVKYAGETYKITAYPPSSISNRLPQTRIVSPAAYKNQNLVNIYFDFEETENKEWGLVTFRIISIPPGGFVSVNDVFIGNTPTNHTYGYKYPNGRAVYSVTVTPPAEEGVKQLFPQTKTIELGTQSGNTDGNTIDLHFDLRLQNFAPRQQIDMVDKK